MTPTAEQVAEAFEGQFMQPQSHGPISYYRIETDNGTWIVPSFVCDSDDIEDFRDYCEGKPTRYERKTGYVYRLSAPGYMDCTNWEAADTLEEALTALLEMSGQD